MLFENGNSDENRGNYSHTYLFSMVKEVTLLNSSTALRGSIW